MIVSIRPVLLRTHPHALIVPRTCFPEWSGDNSVSPARPVFRMSRTWSMHKMGGI